MPPARGLELGALQKCTLPEAPAEPRRIQQPDSSSAHFGSSNLARRLPLVPRCNYPPPTRGELLTQPLLRKRVSSRAHHYSLHMCMCMCMCMCMYVHVHVRDTRRSHISLKYCGFVLRKTSYDRRHSARVVRPPRASQPPPRPMG